MTQSSRPATVDPEAFEVSRYLQGVGRTKRIPLDPDLVHSELARVLEAVLKDRKYSDTWADVADKVISQMGSVVFMSRQGYDDLIKELRALTVKP
jgi:hypothetical protein